MSLLRRKTARTPTLLLLAFVGASVLIAAAADDTEIKCACNTPCGNPCTTPSPPPPPVVVFSSPPPPVVTPSPPPPSPPTIPPLINYPPPPPSSSLNCPPPPPSPSHNYSPPSPSSSNNPPPCSSCSSSYYPGGRPGDLYPPDLNYKPSEGCRNQLKNLEYVFVFMFAVVLVF